MKALECFFDKCVDNAHKNAYTIFEGGERMKRQILLKMFLRSGWRIAREGSNHTILTNDESVEPLPRHKEIKENFAKDLIKKHNLK